MSHRRCSTIALTGQERYELSCKFLDELVRYSQNHQYPEVISNTIAHLWHHESQTKDKLWTNAAQSLGTAIVLISAEAHVKQPKTGIIDHVMALWKYMVFEQGHRVKKMLNQLATDHPARDHWLASLGTETNETVVQAILFTGWAGIQQMLAYQDEL
ncbi:hypothetical protein HUG15_02320 [Salicibibacter cibarius]|uniref:Uncharacterized protein n=2 Tax=Salicibibacter TaxID=2685905 RepID=A0A514LJJ2_9BACI|nr:MULTISPECIES: hypothetical protein [Salicibibacter]QDI92018.1 hypothetical protein EPH95_13205 [Salicibibacter halophilus]QQK74552.1 hypothetical protein HUG15_02320 [Salicibibacter cibarius]